MDQRPDVPTGPPVPPAEERPVDAQPPARAGTASGPRRVFRWFRSQGAFVRSILAAVTVLVTSIGVSFIWPNFILPRTISPWIAVSSSVQAVGGPDEDGFIPVQADVTFSNETKTRVKVMLSWYNMYGIAVVPRYNDLTYFQANLIDSDPETVAPLSMDKMIPSVSSHYLESTALVQSGILLGSAVD